MNATDFWSGFSAFVAAAAFTLALITYLQTRERVIGWSAAKSNVRDIDHRLINTSRGLVAEVIDIDDNFDVPESGRENMIRFAPTMPAVVLPQNWMPVGAHQILGAEPIAIRVTWRQKRLGREKFKPRTYTASIYL